MYTLIISCALLASTVCTTHTVSTTIVDSPTCINQMLTQIYADKRNEIGYCIPTNIASNYVIK